MINIGGEKLFYFKPNSFKNSLNFYDYGGTGFVYISNDKNMSARLNFSEFCR